MAESKDLNTVMKIADYAKKHIDIYRQFPSKKDIVIENLSVVFMDIDCWGKVVKDNKFSSAFKQKMGRGRMAALKKLLNSMDKEHYSQVSFD